MKRIVSTLLIATPLLFVQCGGAEEDDSSSDTNENADTTATSEETETTDEASAEQFEGEDRGDYLLYGFSDIDASENVATIKDFTESVSAQGSFEGKVAIEIAEVCKKAGCWIVFNDDLGTPIRVFFKDHFGIPTETVSGTKAILYGQTQSDTLDVAFQKHLLDDAKEAGEEVTEEDYDAITEDKIETTFDCEAILVAKKL